MCCALVAGADTTGVVSLTGIVPDYIQISVSSSQISLNMRSVTNDPILVNSIHVLSSSNWEIVIESKNKGYLENIGNPSERIGYVLTLGALTPEPASLTTAWYSSVQGPTLKHGYELPLAVQVLAHDTDLTEGVYEDSLTINIKQL